MLNSSLKKILFLIVISLLVFTGWNFGLDAAYTKTILALTNVGLKISGSESQIDFIRDDTPQKAIQYKVNIVVNHRKGSYIHEPGSYIQPFAALLSWQIFLFFILKRKQALGSLVPNLAIFVVIQVIVLIMLTGIYTSDTQSYIFKMMVDSFNIIVLILIIKDSIVYSVFSKKN